ncbi:MAG TPA: redoxin domain-containing protein [Solirubrobacteraceae bacterium]
MRPPVDHIEAPAFPSRLPWINAEPLRIDDERGRPILVEFWDFCRPNSIRTLPYLRAWHERYAPAGLRVIGIHASGFAPSADPDAVTAAVTRLDVPYPVVVDTELEIWQRYGNLGWPARYLFNQDGRLFDFHYGEGGYAETERAIQELLGVDRAPLEPLRPEDAAGAELAPQTVDVPGPYSGPYEAGGVWAVLDGTGEVVANGRAIAVDHPGAYELVSHPLSTVGELALELGAGITCHGVCFTPGLAA